MNKIGLIFTLFLIQVMNAEVSLPSFFSDGMVLQQNAQVKIWGWANPKEVVTIIPSWNKKEYKIEANANAYWELVIETVQAGGPYELEIKGYNTLHLTDILLGEVWFCSGQSNMEMTADWGIDNKEKEIAEANFPQIHFFRTAKVTADYPQVNTMGNWEACTPETMRKNSAVAYYFARRIQEMKPNVPVGLIISAWGGTPAEVWMPKDLFTEDQPFYMKAIERKTSEYCPVAPSKTFNTMIYPLMGYKIAGFLWYQGESNVGELTYKELFTQLIQSWRKLWEEELPFYYVQIAPYQYEGEGTYAAMTRDLQRQVLALPKTGMAVISDVAILNDIHPTNKKTVGIRLADIALKQHYKILQRTAESPLISDAKISKRGVELTFLNNEKLHFTTKENLFEIAGEDEVFYQAKAKIIDGKVMVTCSKVKQPKYVRFAWGNAIQSNLFNEADLPASTFKITIP
jgi:sialate O-acetylesterase